MGIIKIEWKMKKKFGVEKEHFYMGKWTSLTISVRCECGGATTTFTR